jgi:hypothetical protein
MMFAVVKVNKFQAESLPAYEWADSDTGSLVEVSLDSVRGFEGLLTLVDSIQIPYDYVLLSKHNEQACRVRFGSDCKFTEVLDNLGLSLKVDQIDPNLSADSFYSAVSEFEFIALDDYKAPFDSTSHLEALRNHSNPELMIEWSISSLESFCDNDSFGYAFSARYSSRIQSIKSIIKISPIESVQEILAELNADVEKFLDWARDNFPIRNISIDQFLLSGCYDHPITNPKILVSKVSPSLQEIVHASSIGHVDWTNDQNIMVFLQSQIVDVIHDNSGESLDISYKLAVSLIRDIKQFSHLFNNVVRIKRC